MTTQSATVIRLDNISVQDFVKAVNSSMEHSPPKLLIPDRKLSDVCVSFTRKKETGSADENDSGARYQLYMISEDEPLRKSQDRYFVFVADAAEEDNLQSLAFQIRDHLNSRNIVSYFRIDPQQGLVLGSGKETINPFFSDPKPRVAIVLYLVSDISHPGIATYEYVERKYRREYIKVFKKVNGFIPKRVLKIFDMDVLSLRRHKDSFLLRHRDIIVLLNYLLEQGYTDIELSLLYENLSQYELDNLAFKTVTASFLFKGQGKFFHTTNDLLEQ